MTIFEKIKKSFVTDHTKEILTNEPDFETKLKTLSDDPYGGAAAINMNNERDLGSQWFGEEKLDRFAYQDGIIESYRELANKTEVANGIDIICDEIVFTQDPKVFKISIDEENDKISKVINESFKDTLRVLNIKDNMYNIARQLYIDGQLNVSLAYNKKDQEKGIREATILEPLGLYFDGADNTWKYNTRDDVEFMYQKKDPEEYSESEMVHVDFGMYTKVLRENEMGFQVNLGYLENVFKNVNMLEALENMLVPFRYSRSVSRRLFNVDVADLSPKQAKSLMDKIRAEFRYKKVYDPQKGTITNTKGQQPLVEDYWMSNRGGAKGTSIDTMDERGGLLDMDDIQHVAKKLYASMKIPSSRNPYSEDPATFSFDTNQDISKEEMSFYIFISRLRTPITQLIKEIMRRQLIATGVMSDKEWKEYNDKITVEFTAESIFLETMNKQVFLQNLEGFVNIKETIGETISLERAVRTTLGWSTEELTEELEKIQEEKTNPLFKAFYEREEDTQTPSWRS